MTSKSKKELSQLPVKRMLRMKPYEMNLEELKEAEAGFNETDRKAIDMYRQQQLQEWKCLQRRQKYVKLRESCGKHYAKEARNAPEDVFLGREFILNCQESNIFSQKQKELDNQMKLLELYIPMCLLVNDHLNLLAKFPEGKFLKAIVNCCIQNSKDRCLPTILVYKLVKYKQVHWDS
ncbi:LOW QUALITY PROTEIN: phosducin-like protein 2 [Passerculus sandwichensis]